MKLSDLIDFNPKRPLEKGVMTAFIEMADLPEGERDVSGVGNRVFNGGGSKFKNGDTLFARITPCLENGKTAKVSGLSDNAVGHGSTEFIVMAAKDPGVDEDFVYYVARHPDFRAYATGRMEGTSGRQRVSWQAIADYEIPDFSDAERKSIGSILSSIDDLIAKNRRANETLEMMGQALFRGWFVDFEPVRAKVEGRWLQGESLPGMPAHLYDFFPDQLVATEHGEIPLGWSYIPFGKLIESTIGGDWGKEVPEEDHSTAVSIIRGTDFPAITSGGIGKVPTRYTTEKKLASRQLQAGDIVVEISGGSPTQPTGRSVFISEATLKRFSNAVVCASFCRRLRPKSAELGALAFMHLQNLYAAGGTWKYQNQSTGIANFQTTHFLESELVAIPSEDLLRVFATQAQSLLENISRNENLSLAQLRDTLLPKLISGEMRVPEAERIVGAAV
jgi:type I restriction enzyme S subunit